MADQPLRTVCLVPVDRDDYIIALKFEKYPEKIAYLRREFYLTTKRTKGGYRIYRER